jgi:glycosyltransferase involved in cell wall biosynthesis
MNKVLSTENRGSRILHDRERAIGSPHFEKASTSPVNVLIFELYPFDLVSGNLRTLSYILKLIDRARFNPVLVTPFESEFTQKVVEQGFDLNVVKPPERLRRYGGKCLNDSLWGKFLTLLEMIPYNVALWRVIKEKKIDVIYCNCIRAVISIGFAAKLSRTPIMLYIKGELQNKILDPIGFAVADKIFFFCEANKNDKYPRLIKKFTNKIGILKIGLDLDMIFKIENRDKTRLLCEWSIDCKRINIAYAGLLNPLKGVHYLLEAMSTVVRTFPDAMLYIIGDYVIDEHRNYKDELIDLIKKNNLQNNVVFTGWRTDALDLVSLMDILVHPSLSEGFGRAVLEAMALGKAVVASKVGGLREIIRDGKNGFLVEPGNSQELVQKLMLLLKDRERIESFGRAARETVFTDYSIMEKVVQLEEIWHAMASMGDRK